MRRAIIKSRRNECINLLKNKKTVREVIVKNHIVKGAINQKIQKCIPHLYLVIDYCGDKEFKIINMQL